MVLAIELTTPCSTRPVLLFWFQVRLSTENPSTIAKILKHLGLPAIEPPMAPVKNPAYYEFTEFAEFT